MRRSRYMEPCTMPNSAWSSRVCALWQRAAQRCVRSMASRACLSSQGQGAHTSNAMAMSLPSFCCISMELSGVMRWREPSMWLRKSTPSSRILRSPASENTWNPPESVSMGRFQFMKECSPPALSTRSSPGRRCRWYVLESIICAFISSSSRGSMVFTVACVPTGMNMGVSITPWGVCSLPRRAPVCASMCKSSNSNIVCSCQAYFVPRAALPYQHCVAEREKAVFPLHRLAVGVKRVFAPHQRRYQHKQR